MRGSYNIGPFSIFFKGVNHLVETLFCPQRYVSVTNPSRHIRPSPNFRPIGRCSFRSITANSLTQNSTRVEHKRGYVKRVRHPDLRNSFFIGSLKT